MKNYDFVLAIDPSGSFHEGKGTTGWCVFNCLDNVVSISDYICAKTFGTMEQYWDAHIQLIARMHAKYKNKLIVVIEDYILYAHKAKAQINSHLETPKLIGVLQHYCWSKNIPYRMQLATEVKSRWRDHILHYYKYLAKRGKSYVLPLKPKVKLLEHQRDAIRHAVHFAKFKNGRSKQ